MFRNVLECSRRLFMCTHGKKHGRHAWKGLGKYGRIIFTNILTLGNLFFQKNFSNKIDIEKLMTSSSLSSTSIAFCVRLHASSTP
jgi:hypothetical protein